MTAFLCEMAEKWQHVGFASGFVLLICAFVFTKVTRLKFFIFLLASTAYILLFRFPEVANHVNFIILVNLTLIAGIVYSWFRPTWQDQDFYEMIKPPMRLSMVLVYFLTGFHKFNQDFFRPQVSCITDFLSQFVWLLEKSWVWFVPSSVILAGAIALIYAQLFSNPLKKFSRPTQFILIALIAIGITLFGRLIGLTYDIAQAHFLTPVVVFTAGIVILWELVGSVCLLFPRTQGPMIALSLGTHAAFTLIGFVDFSALALALLFTFIPLNYLQVLNRASHVRLAGLKVHRVHAYVLILLVGFFFGGIHHKIYPIYGPKVLTALFISGMIFLAAAGVLFWPVLSTLFSCQRLPWRGVPIYTAKASPKASPTIFLISGCLIFLVGMSPYLGLRTAGTFSMFSNLRTEGAESNHLLLSANPLKVWGYQEDIVEVTAIDDDAARLGHKYRPLKGYKLPTVEFRKLIYKWTQADYTVPVTFLHNGVEYTSPDIVSDPLWRSPRRNWEMYLMDFRIIQPEGANQCRW